ncbi:DUF6712 family protein [Hymenobacter fodinae]|uniref:Uncharacterized protein n=1 Tax=Hymenobacter fodinae TaxID=2510796 RepID=A0A4Z0P7U9_9BACT|nr:DUF6712 family protein [Hymenobacter fodinae]TGE08249.1 hypothetical protein EU556_11035 [Hymenobacter fodinae]
MTALKHLITSDEVTERTVVQVNAGHKKITIAIPLAEGRRLRPLLGDRLFDELLAFAQKEASDVADPLASLANEVKNMLAEWTVVQAWPSLSMHVTDAGMTVKNGKDVSTSADYKTTQDLLAMVTGNAEYYSSEFVRWITEHKSDYPSYAPYGSVAAPSSGLIGGLDC